MDEDGYLLVHRIGLDKKLALVSKDLLLDVLVLEALEAERKSRTEDERARPHAQQLQLIFASHFLLVLSSFARVFSVSHCALDRIWRERGGNCSLWFLLVVESRCIGNYALARADDGRIRSRDTSIHNLLLG